MTGSELKRKLAALGCTFAEGKKHIIVTSGEKTTVMPRHPKKEIKTGTYNAILKDLGLKEEKK